MVLKLRSTYINITLGLNATRITSILGCICIYIQELMKIKVRKKDENPNLKNALNVKVYDMAMSLSTKTKKANLKLISYLKIKQFFCNQQYKVGAGLISCFGLQTVECLKHTRNPM